MGPTWVLSTPDGPHKPCYQGTDLFSWRKIFLFWFQFQFISFFLGQITWSRNCIAWRQTSDKPFPTLKRTLQIAKKCGYYIIPTTVFCARRESVELSQDSNLKLPLWYFFSDSQGQVALIINIFRFPGSSIKSWFIRSCKKQRILETIFSSYS